MRRGFLNSGGSTKPPPAPSQAAPPPAPKQAQSSADEAAAFVQRIVDAAFAGGADALHEEILRLDAASDATFGTWVIRGGLDALASDPRPGGARDRYTALCAVALGGDPACVRLLLHAKASVDTRDAYNATPLILAAANCGEDKRPGVSGHTVYQTE